MNWFRVSRGEGIRQYVPYTPALIEDSEEALESDLEANPHVLMAPSRLMYIGRQMRTPDGRKADLVAVTRERRIVVVELKKGLTPRSILTQGLEYLAFIESLTPDQLDQRAREYFLSRGQPWQSVAEAHASFFEGEIPPGEPEFAYAGPPIVIVQGQVIAPQIIEVVTLLRRHNIDIRVVRFAYHVDNEGNRFVAVERVIGEEDQDSVADNASRQPDLDESLTDSPRIGAAFEKIRSGLAMLGLREQRRRTQMSFEKPGSGVVIAAWPSPRRDDRIYLLFYHQRIAGDLDAFQRAVDFLGFHTVRGRDLSVHVLPKDSDMLDDLLSAIRALLSEDGK